MKLSFATKFVQSNDLFYAPDGEGIAVWGDDGPITGDITDQIMLWDAGTEVNQEPGTGADQPIRGGNKSGAADCRRKPFAWPPTTSAIFPRCRTSSG